MGKKVLCSHCGSNDVDATHKNYVKCKKCQGTTDTRNPMTAFLGHAVGASVAIIGVGLLPDELTDGIADGVADIMDDLLS